MHRAVLFPSRFMLGLWIALMGAFLFLLFSNAPVDGLPFSGLSIRSESGIVVHVPTRIFKCTETEKQIQCEANIQNYPLVLTGNKWTKFEGDPTSLKDCQAQYDGRPVSCKDMGYSSVIGLPNTYEVTGLELSASQVKTLQQKFWGATTLTNLAEPPLMLIGTGLSLVGGMIVAYFVWLHPHLLSKLLASFACGFGIYHGLFYPIANLTDSVITADITFETQSQIIQGCALTIGAVTMLLVTLVLLRSHNLFTKVLASISVGVSTFILCSLSFRLTGLSLSNFFNLSSVSLQAMYSFMWIVSVISVGLAIAAVILLWLNTRQSIKRFLCLVSGVGSVTLVANLSLFILLWLGYAD